MQIDAEWLTEAHMTDQLEAKLDAKGEPHISCKAVVRAFPFQSKSNVQRK